ncbi:hypothetical protein [Fodinicola feengrottensis]|uniref:hypothetical protein n=1 Tax=Fodinicola feengrottensis TaxID=435914 RepID=UPI0024410D72|nr:hypothetical protein [Fodinicola feengrottensis]
MPASPYACRAIAVAASDGSIDRQDVEPEVAQPGGHQTAPAADHQRPAARSGLPRPRQHACHVFHAYALQGDRPDVPPVDRRNGRRIQLDQRCHSALLDKFPQGIYQSEVP